MLYDEVGPPPPHLRLSLPTLEQLAAHDGLPSRQVQDAIVAASRDAEDVYRIHAEVHQTYRDVTIGQVARVLLDRR